MSDEFGLPTYYQGHDLKMMQQRLNSDYLATSGWNESADRKMSLRDGKPVPWFTYAAIDFLEKIITPDLRLFEYGGGNSTLYWAERLRQVVSLDHDPAFADYIRPRLPAHAEMMIFAENAPMSDALASQTKDRPRFTDPPRSAPTYRSGQLNEAFARYALELARWPSDSFDFIVIDGMARVLSTWAAIQHFRKGGFIVFDNSDREEYREAYTMLDDAGYRRLDFAGLGPINPYGWATSVFYKPAAFRGTTWFRPQEPSGRTREEVNARPEREDKLGILVLGFNRPMHLQAVLESLRLQGRIGDAHVWIDGTQGRGEYVGSNEKTVEIAKRFAVKEVRAIAGHLGIEKLMLDGLAVMSSLYSRVLVLEDDCFPVKGMVEKFEAELQAVQDRNDVFSVYGHHFGTELEGEKDFSRFQGWGWAAHSSQIQRVLPELNRLFALPEDEYLAAADSLIDDVVRERLDVTPGRDVLKVLKQFYSWDSATTLLTALMDMKHRRTTMPTVRNTGISKGIGHFQADSARLRKPPFNMIKLEECWDYFEVKASPAIPDRPSYGLDGLDLIIDEHLPDEPGFFIELGAFDGITQSNSVHLERKGWKGMLIEANPGPYAKCVKARSSCIVENYACVSSDFEQTTLQITDVGLMSVAATSDFDSATFEDWVRRGSRFSGREPQILEVPVSTLSALIDKHDVTEVDLLLLDVEGAEINVLRGIDFKRHAPARIVAEDAYTDDIEKFLEVRGYRKAAILLERKYTRDQLYVRGEN